MLHKHNKSPALCLVMPEMLLEDVVVGATYVIHSIEQNSDNKALFESLGVSPGREMTVVRNNPIFPFILEFGGSNYALSRSYANKITVCPAEECLDDYASPSDCESCRRHRRSHRIGR